MTTRDHVTGIENALAFHYQIESILLIWDLADEHSPAIRKQLKRLARDIDSHPQDHVDDTLWNAHLRWFQTIAVMISELEG